MARSLGTLSLDLVARIGGFEQGLSRAERTTRQRMRGIEESTNTATAALGQLRSILIAIGGTAAITRAISRTADFSQSIADLSAITGATGDDLEYYRKQALEIGRTTSLSASQAAEAFKLIAAAKPDLLENAEALNEVSRQAVTLAEATGIDLPTAAAALGSALNQFGLDADRASEVINILAASAQLGTAEVSAINEALRNAGPAAQALNVDLAETVAGLQALAKAGRQGSDAGTGLRQVMLRLERTGNQNLQPSVVGLVGALNNLADMNLSNTELMELFGDQAFAAAAALLEQRDTAERLNSTLRGTNSAVEQAATRMDTLKMDVAALGSALEGLMLAAFGNDLEDINRTLVQAATEGVNTLTENIDKLTTAVQVFAAIYGARLAGGLATSIGLWGRNRLEILRYNQALASMAGISSSAALGLTAMGTAAGVARGALALVGGPAGAAVLAAYGIYRLTDSYREGLRAQEARIEKLREEYDATRANMSLQELYEDNLRRGFDAMAAYTNKVDQAFADSVRGMNQEELQKQIDASTAALQRAEARLNRFTEAGNMSQMRMMQAEEAVRRYRSELAILNGIYPSLTTSEDQLAESMKAVLSGLEDQIYELEKGREAFELLQLTRRAGVEEGSREAQQIQDLIRQREALRAAIDEETEARRRQDAVNAEAQRIVESLMSEEERVKESYQRRRQIILDNTEVTGEAQRDLLLRLEEQKNAELERMNEGFWERWLRTAESSLTDMDELVQGTLQTFSAGFGQAFERLVFDSDNLRDAFAGMIEGIARSMIRALGEMAGQWLAYKAVQLATGKTAQASAAATMTANAYAMVAQSALAAFASTAAIPIIGPAAAPAAAAAAATATLPMAATVSSLALAGMAHDGIDSVPATGTWLLEKGERVTTAETSAKLDATLDNIARNIGGGNRGIEVNVENYTGEKIDVQRQQLTDKDVITIVAGNFRQRGAIHAAAKGSLNVKNRTGTR